MALNHKGEYYTEWTHSESGKHQNRRLHLIMVQRGDGRLVELAGPDLPDSIISFAGNGHKDLHTAYIYSQGDTSAFTPNFRPHRRPAGWRRSYYAEPAWPYNNQATRAATSNHYPTMSVDDICDEPVEQLCHDQAHLHLWTTNGFLPDAFDVLGAWGFTYKSCFLWVKPQIGIGNYWRVSHEFLLLGVRGKLAFQDKGARSWIEHKRAEHSRKPLAVRELVERVRLGPYLEMYGRQTPPNERWTVYGNQVQ